MILQTLVMFGLLILLGSGIYTGLVLAGIGIVGVDFFKHLGGTIGAVLFNTSHNFVLAAIPMFLLLGELLLQSGLSGKLYEGVSKWTRVLPGGLLHSNIVASAIFSAVSGSSAATAATIATVAYPEQRKRGYDPKSITGSLAAGGTLGNLIPPSINMILYGAYVGQSVGRLFIAGVLPGIIVSIMYMCYYGFASIQNKSLTPPRERITKRFFLDGLVAWKYLAPIIFIIVVIMGSLYGGILTATEAAGASSFLALVVGLVFGKMNFSIVKNSAMSALKTTSMILLLFIGASILGNALGLMRIPAYLAKVVAGMDLSPLETWLMVVVLYLILGMVMDTLAMMLITLPVTFPLIVTSAGFDPIWFGVQLVMLCEIGMITPPVALNLFVIHGIAKDLPMSTIIRGVLPIIAIMLIALAVFTFAPDIILFLPNHMLGK